MNKPKLEYKELTKSQYDALNKKYNNVLYFIYDTQQLFKGDVEWCPADGTGDKLPVVTAEDDGDVLTVVDGAWDKAPASGGDNDFVVTYTENDGTQTADKTFAEIKAAIEAGKNIKALYSMGSVVYVFIVSFYVITEGIVFDSISLSDNNIVTIITINHSSENAISVYSKNIS